MSEIVEAEGRSKEEAVKKLLELLAVESLEQVTITDEKITRKFLGVGGKIWKLQGKLNLDADDGDFQEINFEKEDIAEAVETTSVDESEGGDDNEVILVEAEGDDLPDRQERVLLTTLEATYQPEPANKGKNRIKIPFKGRGYKKRLYQPDPSDDSDREIDSEDLYSEYENENLSESSATFSNRGNNSDNQVARDDSLEHDPAVYSDDEESPVSDEIRVKAVAFLETILKGMDADAKIDGFCLTDKLLIDVSSQNQITGLLIGKRGVTLNALESLIDIMINKTESNRIRVTVDINRYRERCLEKIKTIARDGAYDVVRRGQPVSLPPMNGAERRVVHMMLADSKEVVTFSEGEGRRRRIVIAPAGSEDRKSGNKRKHKYYK
ncbi:MAG: protein jag [Nitrospinota bacterium]